MQIRNVLISALVLVSCGLAAQEFSSDSVQVQQLPGGGRLIIAVNYSSPFGAYEIQSERATLFTPSAQAQVTRIDLDRALLVDSSGHLPPIYVGNAHLQLDAEGNVTELTTDRAIVAAAATSVIRADGK